MNSQQKIALIQEQILQYPLLNDTELLSKLITKDIAIKVLLPVRSLKLYLVSKNLWLPFKNSTEESVEIARDSIEMFSPNIDTINQYSLFEVLIQGLVNSTSFQFNAENRADILDMANSFESWADQNIPNITVGDIMRARL